MITLTNFKQEIDSTILQRGRKYYRDGQVVDLEETDDGMWSAQVEGTELYEIEVEQSSNGELSLLCTCPYDWGPVCKHIAAVLYAIEETFPAYVENKPKKPRKPRQTRLEKVTKILRELAHEELTALLTELATEHREIANLILARHAEEGDDKKAYIRLVKDALNQGKGQYGFIDYTGAVRAARGIHSLLQRADGDLDHGNISRAIVIYQAVFETVVEAINHADDSTGSLGGCIASAIEGLGEAGELLSAGERQALFEYCLVGATNERFRGWDWPWDLVVLAAGMVSTPDQRKQLYATLDQMAGPQNTSDDPGEWESEFQAQRAAEIKLAVIERLDDEKTMVAFLEELITLPRFRERLTRRHMERRNYTEARRLSEEWLKQNKSSYPGYRSAFLSILLNIARIEKNPDEIARIAEEMFLATGDFSFYELVKQTVGENSWVAVRDRIIQTSGADHRARYHVAAILVREELWDQLLAWVKKQPSDIERTRKYLDPRFPAEMCALYERSALRAVELNANRGGYQEACMYLRRMQKLGKKERAAEIVADWRAKYPRRRALLEELASL